MPFNEPTFADPDFEPSDELLQSFGIDMMVGVRERERRAQAAMAQTMERELAALHERIGSESEQWLLPTQRRSDV
jgi:hypothetical protein